MPIKAVFFDVGETLVDETRHWALWTDYLGVPHFTFFAALGAVVAQRRHHREVFRIFDPGFDYHAAKRERERAGETYEFLPSDFYPDALACLEVLKARGYLVGVSGNQPEGCEAALRAAGVEADILASSATWGVEKPSPLFFERIVVEAKLASSEIAYVGDHWDNDIVPAHDAGLVPVFIERGPWAHLARGDHPACVEIRNLSELPDALSQL